MIYTGKAQQLLACAIGSRKQRDLGVEREIRGKARIALGDADRLLCSFRRPTRLRAE
ncbi:hypothetical protein [Noviherbaspirillum pedocola]|uniref:Uncharacterized protein n=1 Tax=Noviherbaspirillum pedocola TaxID=2801341 RepID=A0A934SY92_9BURK|nr:hypothetical protein [Noviherbaspirillum pedocola]MBK4737525.1 hypothetical protein [Noviherbaspirillum pedocola]